MKTVPALLRWGGFLAAGLLLAHADSNSATSPPPATTSTAPKTGPTGPWVTWVPARPATGSAPEWNGATGDDVGQGGSAGEGADPENAERIAEQTYAMNQDKQQHPQSTTVDETAKQQAYDQDWMLRNYTDELKKRHLEKADYTNPYLSSETMDAPKDLLADDPLLDPPEKKKTPKSASLTSDIDNPETLKPKKSLTALTFQPLLNPLISNSMAHPDAAGSLVDESALNTGASLLPVPSVRPTDEMGVTNDGSVASLLDVPGLTAASQGGIAPNNAIDFNDSGAPMTNRPRSDNFLAPTAQPNDVAEFFKKQALALAPPTAPGTVPTVAQPFKPHVILNLEPTAKPAISSMRTHVDDPFDILQR